MLQKAYKFRIYPNNTQKVLLAKTFGCCRYAWNSWVDNFKKTEDQVFKTPKDFKSELEWMKEVSSSAIQQKERDFQEFKNQFFNKARKKKLGRPQFKSKRNKQSYRLPNQKFSINDNKIRLEKIGFVKMVADRDIPENVKFVNATISRDTCNDYYVSILVEENIKPKEKTSKEVGIDVGLKSFAVLSDGTVVDNPKHFRENQPELKRVQQHLSRKVRGSNRYRRNKMKVSKFHRKIARQRSYFLHNVTSSIVSNYDVIAVEDLNVSGMVKNHCLAKSIHDASWSEFFRQLSYKCEWYGKELRKADRFEPTSKTCSICGFYYKDLTLKIREWRCPCCNTKHDRDANASTNILKKSAGVEAELQTRRGCKTSEDIHSKATPCEVSRVLLERNTFL
jgi:putative transposase